MSKYYLKFLLFSFGLFVLTLTANAQPLNALFHQAGDPIAGNPKGDVTIVEFFDYQCSHCITMAPIMDAIIKSNPNVRVVFKDYPILSAESRLEARAALAANKQGKYYPFYHAFFTNDKTWDLASILQFAKDMGLDANKLKKDMDSSSVTDQLEANLQLAHEVNVTGTPGFFIGKTNAQDTSKVEFVLGEMSQGELQNAINKASQ